MKKHSKSRIHCFVCYSWPYTSTFSILEVDLITFCIPLASLWLPKTTSGPSLGHPGNPRCPPGRPPGPNLNAMGFRKDSLGTHLLSQDLILKQFGYFKDQFSKLCLIVRPQSLSDHNRWSLVANFEIFDFRLRFTGGIWFLDVDKFLKMSYFLIPKGMRKIFLILFC